MDQHVSNFLVNFVQHLFLQNFQRMQQVLKKENYILGLDFKSRIILLVLLQTDGGKELNNYSTYEKNPHPFAKSFLKWHNTRIRQPDIALK